MNWYLKVLKQYSDFNGRARRKEYWMFFLFNVLIVFILGLIEGYFDLFATTDESVIGGIYQLAVFIPSLAVGMRRMHDVGKPGWYVFIPIYNLILSLTDGDRLENQYGQDPKSE
jgi:uncharacterized membrane protein YhaH (DUF805 family)